MPVITPSISGSAGSISLTGSVFISGSDGVGGVFELSYSGSFISGSGGVTSGSGGITTYSSSYGYTTISSTGSFTSGSGGSTEISGGGITISSSSPALTITRGDLSVDGTISGSGQTTFGANMLMSGDQYVGGDLDVSGTVTFAGTTITLAGVAAGTDDTVLVYNGSTIVTDEIDNRVWGNTLVDATNGTDNEIAIFTDANSVEGDTNLTWDGSQLTIGGAISGSGQTTLGANMLISGDQYGGGTLNVTGAVTFAGPASGSAAGPGSYLSVTPAGLLVLDEPHVGILPLTVETRGDGDTISAATGFCVVTAGNSTVTLSSPTAGKELAVKLSASVGYVTLNAAGGTTVENGNSILLESTGSAVQLIGQDTQSWWVV